jgi:very-short-patch-repair endonuclease
MVGWCDRGPLDGVSDAGVDTVVPAHVHLSDRVGVRVHRVNLEEGEIVRRDGLPVTSPLRTCVDLARDIPLMDAVAMIDVMAHSGLVRLADLESYVESHAGAHRIRHVRRAFHEVEPLSESPMESRLRLTLVMAGLPRPQAQVTLRDGRHFLGRPDLYYPEARLCIEYDGDIHRDQLTSDNRRQNRLVGECAIGRGARARPGVRPR